MKKEKKDAKVDALDKIMGEMDDMEYKKKAGPMGFKIEISSVEDEDMDDFDDLMAPIKGKKKSK